MLLASVGEPALAIFGLSGDIAPLSVSDSAPKFAGAINLVALSSSFALIGQLVALDDLEIRGGVFFATIREPAFTIFSLSGNFTPLSVGDSTP